MGGFCETYTRFYDSHDFLEEIYPDPPMGPKEPLKKAYDRMLLSHYDIVRFKFYYLQYMTKLSS